MTTADDLLDDLQWRGLIAVSTDLGALHDALDAGPVTFYVGFDPTAPSLHHGHLVQVLTARRLQQAGHRPLALVGGSTGLIGDPRPSAERTLNTKETVAAWVENIRAQTRASMEAFSELLEAEREAAELARNPGGVGGSSPMPRGNNNPTISQLDVEFATELIEVGFGGLVR